MPFFVGAFFVAILFIGYETGQGMRTVLLPALFGAISYGSRMSNQFKKKEKYPRMSMKG